MIVSPFVVCTDDIPLFLGAAISDMIAVRMRDIVSIVKSQLMADDLDCVDYLLTGDLTVVDEIFTTRAEFIDIKNGETSFDFTFSGVEDTSGGVLTHVDELCCRLSTFFFKCVPPS